MRIARGTIGADVGGRPDRASLLLFLTSLLLTSVIARNVYLSYQGPDYAAQRLADRKSYYMKVIRKANVSLRPADFYEVIR